MKRSRVNSKKSSSVSKSKNLFLLAIVFVLGAASTGLVTMVLAHGGDTSKIHACVKSSNGSIRIVGANDSCDSNEVPLDWNIQGIQGPPGSGGSSDFICINCDRRDLLIRLNRQDFLNADLDSAIIVTSNGFDNEDFSGSSFVRAVISISGVEANLSNTNFTDAHLSTSIHAKFTNANLTRTHFTVNDYDGSNFTNAVLTDAFFDNGSNLSHGNFTGSNLNGVTGMDGDSAVDGAIWSNTICPDGTNSDNNGNTCIGHLTP